MRKRFIIIPAATIVGFGIALGGFLSNDYVSLVGDNVMIEASAKLDPELGATVQGILSKMNVVDTFRITNTDIKIQVNEPFNSDILQVESSTGAIGEVISVDGEVDKVFTIIGDCDIVEIGRAP